MRTEKIIFIEISNERPDFRLVATWLWNGPHDIDSDGNSDNPASRQWTELYLCSRQNSDEMIDISPVSENPLILRVNGSTSEMVSRAAYFLAVETNGQLFTDEALSNSIGLEDLKLQVGNFDIENAMKRTRESRWRKSSIDKPYP